MIKSIRGRLQWWYGAVYAISIIVFGTVVYWRADRDVHERAASQAVSAAQYLDARLRSIRPDTLGKAGQLRGDESPDEQQRDSFPPDFSLGPLPPEFQFRPRREQDTNHKPPLDENGRPFPDRPERKEPFAGRPIDESEGDQRLQNADRPITGPDGSRRRGPHGRFEIPGERMEELAQLPGTEFSDGHKRPRPPLDRMEFAVWRPDGSVLTSSDGFPSARTLTMPNFRSQGPEPVVNMRAGVEVLKHGPQGALIQVLRPIEHDMANLYRFGSQIAGMALVTLIVGLAGGWWISGRIVKPIAIISETAARISATSLSRRIETSHLDEELVQLASVLNSTFGRLEQSFGRLTQFTADASHELRTPVTLIQLQAELALSQPRTPEAYQQTLEICLRSSERMRSLIDGLLLLARTDSERLELRPSPIDLCRVAEDAVAQLQDKAGAAGIDLECSTPESAVLVLGDPRFLAQIPANLIDNAIQHSSSGGKILLEVRLEKSEAVFTIKDSGCGIAAEHLPYLFERFYRVDVGRSRKQGGSGLGLAICKSLVEAHNGTIGCESKVGEGTTFVVRLPLTNSSLTNAEIQDA